MSNLTDCSLFVSAPATGVLKPIVYIMLQILTLPCMLFLLWLSFYSPSKLKGTPYGLNKGMLVYLFVHITLSFLSLPYNFFILFVGYGHRSQTLLFWLGMWPMHYQLVASAATMQMSLHRLITLWCRAKSQDQCYAQRRSLGTTFLGLLIVISTFLVSLWLIMGRLQTKEFQEDFTPTICQEFACILSSHTGQQMLEMSFGLINFSLGIIFFFANGTKNVIIKNTLILSVIMNWTPAVIAFIDHIDNEIQHSTSMTYFYLDALFCAISYLKTLWIQSTVTIDLKKT